MKKMILVLVLLCTTGLQAGFLQEEDKRKHMVVSSYFGAVGGLACRGSKGFNLRGWQAIMCGTAIGIIPGVLKEWEDERAYGGWDNRDLAADAIGSFVGSLGVVTIYKFNSGKW